MNFFMGLHGPLRLGPRQKVAGGYFSKDMTTEKIIAAYNAAGPKGQKFITGRALQEMRRMGCPVKSRTSLHHWRTRGGKLPRSPINLKYKKAFTAAVAAYEAQKKEDGQKQDFQTA